MLRLIFSWMYKWPYCYFKRILITHLVDNESQLTSTQLKILGDISKKVDNIVSQVAGEHKDMHGALSKIGKSIDRVSGIMPNMGRIL